MHYFIDSKNVVYAFDNKGDAGKGMMPVSEQEALALANPPPTESQLRDAVLGQRDTLLSEAAIRMAPLQDAEDLGEAIPQEVAALKAWKRYRVALNRIELHEGFPTSVEWPLIPT